MITAGTQIKRRRQCLECQERFTTFETAELGLPHVIKRDGRREVFNIENLRSGLLKALEKRPVAIETIETAIQTIISIIHRGGEREVHSHAIGQLVMQQLYQLDHVAYVRFASVYKRFEDVSDFQQAIDEIKQ